MSKEREKCKERLSEEKLDALIILDAGYEEVSQGEYELTFESKMRLLAGAQLYSLGLTKKLILCGGKLRGKNQPSNSQVMKDFLLSPLIKIRFGVQIHEEDIILEEESRNTSENFHFVKEILNEHPDWQKIGVLSHAHHLVAGAKIASRVLNLSPEFFSAEEILKARSPHYRRLIRDYYTFWLKNLGSAESRQVILTGIENLSRLFVLFFDRKGKIFSKLADRNITATSLSERLIGRKVKEKQPPIP